MLKTVIFKKNKCRKTIFLTNGPTRQSAVYSLALCEIWICCLHFGGPKSETLVPQTKAYTIIFTAFSRHFYPRRLPVPTGDSLIEATWG